MSVTMHVAAERSVMPGDTIIPVEKALECVRQFWDFCERPDCIEWREL